MKIRLIFSAAAVVVGLLSGGILVGRAQTTDAVESANLSVNEAEGTEAYEDQLAVNNAAAEAWKAAHPQGVDVDAPSTEEADLLANNDCPEGTQFWRRDRITELCAPQCTSDADCGPEEGRCRVLDVASEELAPAVVLADELPFDELPVENVLDTVEVADEVMADPLAPKMLCDPFFDVEGAVDADIVLAEAELESSAAASSSVE